MVNQAVEKEEQEKRRINRATSKPWMVVDDEYDPNLTIPVRARYLKQVTYIDGSAAFDQLHEPRRFIT